MHDEPRLTEDRISRVLGQRIHPAVYPVTAPLTVTAWQAPGEPVPVAEALAAPYRPIAPGTPWGRPWGTTWFHVTGAVPTGWAEATVEAVLDIGFPSDRVGFSCEGMVYRPDGSPVKGLNPRSRWVRVTGPDVDLYVEAASNPVMLGGPRPRFAPTTLGDTETAGEAPQYRLGPMELAVFDADVWELARDVEVLDGLMRELPADDARRARLRRTLATALDALDLQDIGATAPAARAALAPALAAPAAASAHRVSAVGHAHIDSAWLWPVREAVRKVARTAANVTALLDEHPELVYAMSSAQQFAWLEEYYPELFARVRDAVAGGRFVPVGGMWVESDTNLPGGEALARQFVHGKRYFLDRFGIETEEVWLPDSFGYSAALPQLVAESGSRWFLTQKISWSQTNAFPHHTFAWEGIDGTRVFTHFPPVDTYDAELTGAELAHAARNFADKGVATRSLVPFGHGDGGGGPTREMLARAARLSTLDGSPTVDIQSPREFFTAAAAEYPDPPVWVGELYLEFHRGTYTSQAQTKQGNRRSEHALREAELWAATATVRTGAEYPYDALEHLWRMVLLNQFHDILPGSSIAWVHRQARAEYRMLGEAVEGVIHTAQRALAGEPETEVVFNAAPHDRDGIPALGAVPRAVPPAPATVSLTRTTGGHVLRNDLLTVTVDTDGVVRSVHDTTAARELVPPGGAVNLLQLHQDYPNAWDAWDVDRFYRDTVTDLTAAEEIAEVPAEGGVALRVRRRFGASSVTQTLTLRGGQRRLEVDTEVDWRETEKFLKLAFDLDVHTDRAAAEIQFGHLYRPTHANTTWDAAKFEVCAHRWVHVGEPGYGVALANDGTYGHDVTRQPVPGGATASTVRASLLRAPRYPDPETDHGVHTFAHALIPGATVADAVREGYRINLPTRAVAGSGPVEPLLRLDNPAVVVEAVKLADDRSGDVVVRLYEAAGGRAEARLLAGFAVRAAWSTDLLERVHPGTVRYAVADGAIPLRLRPFQVVTLRLTPDGTA